MEKKVIATKTYTIKLELCDDDSTRLTRTNDGFNFYELLGLTARIQMELMQLVANDPSVQPDVIVRQVMK